MKASRFNLFIETDDGHVLAYNAVTGAFACVEREIYDALLEAFSNTNAEKTGKGSRVTNRLTVGDVADFYKRGFLIGDGLDEFELLKSRQYEKRFLRKDMLDITVIPAMGCNFNCMYCFEKDKSGKQSMTRETADSIIKYIDDYFTLGGDLTIGWFGGEPTLASDIIYYIMDSVMDIVTAKQVRCFSRITTNGYLLDAEMAMTLKKRGVREAGITIDGGPQAHDARRPLKNGNGTFDGIMENIRSIADILSVTVKFTADRDNLRDFPVLLQTLEKEGLKKKVRIEVSQLEAYPYSCEMVKDRALTLEEFSKVYLELMEIVVENGFYAILLPVRNRIACTAVSENSLVVGPEGELYKCIATVGMENQVFGNIHDPLTQNANLSKWLHYFPLENDECTTCNVLPICMGGCPRNLILKEYAPLNAEAGCMQFRYNLEQLVKLMYRQYKNHKYKFHQIP